MSTLHYNEITLRPTAQATLIYMILNQFVVKIYLYLKCSVKSDNQNTKF